MKLLILIIAGLVILVYCMFAIVRAYYLWQIDQENKDE